MITESQYRPPVLMIRMKGHEKSEEYAEVSRKTWEKRGYSVTYMDAITPETMHTFEDPQIRFAYKIAIRSVEKRRQKLQKDKGFKFEGIFSDTEKAVWYSHVKAWRQVASGDEPTIICEHDAKLRRKYIPCMNHDFYMMTKNILGAAFFHPALLRRFLKGHLQYDDNPFVVRLNPDAHMYDYIMKHCDSQRGDIRTRTHFVRKENKKKKSYWPVDTDWADSTIEHRLFYDEEADETIQWYSNKRRKRK